jgi:hypothetical protein
MSDLKEKLNFRAFYASKERLVVVNSAELLFAEFFLASRLISRGQKR